MSKKHKKGKSGGSRPHKKRGGVRTGKNDVISLMMNENVLIGAVSAVATAFLVDAVGVKFVPNIHARNAVKALVPAFAVNTLIKNPLATMVAAGVGLSLGLGSYAEALTKTAPGVKGVFGDAPDTFTGTAEIKGIIGESVFTQTQGDPRTIEMQPNVNGEYEPVYNVNGQYVGKRIVAKGTAAKNNNGGFPRHLSRGDFISGSYDDPSVNGTLGSDYDPSVNGDYESAPVSGNYFMDQTA